VDGARRQAKRKKAGIAPAFSISSRLRAYSAATILPLSHLNRLKLGELRSPVAP